MEHRERRAFLHSRETIECQAAEMGRRVGVSLVSYKFQSYESLQIHTGWFYNLEIIVKVHKLLAIFMFP